MRTKKLTTFSVYGIARLSAGLAVALALGTAATANAATFTYAGFTFEQDNTPDSLSLLGNGDVLGGAAFSAGTVTSITRSVGFLASSGNAGSGFVGVPGFDPSLTLGRQGNAQQGLTQGDGTSCVFGCAINMPNGNNGTSTRHGIALTWSDGRQLVNGAGDDFVVYESASGGNLSNREAYMVRVELADGGFSEWRYEIVDGFEAYTQTPTPASTGATATAFDLSDFGLSPDEVIKSIQIANLTADDLVDGAGEGNVNFAGVGNAPLSSAGGDPFDSGARDPDPLYVGVLGRLQAAADVPGPGMLALFGIGLAGLGFARRRKAA